MKKVRMVFVCILALTLMATAGYAATTNFDSITTSGTNDMQITRHVPIPLGSFTALNATANTIYGAIGATSAPSWSLTASMPAATWAFSGTAAASATPLSATFRVPADYYSGGSFRVLATQSGVNQRIDFEVLINAGSAVFDSVTTDQTAVNLGTAGTTSPVVATLTPATDLTGLAAGNWITLRLWRGTGSTDNGTLYVHGVDFLYTANQ